MGVTAVIIARQVPSPSEGAVAVNQSTILRSPVLVFCSAGWARSMPESRMPIVTPRPSQALWPDLKATAPVSLVGMYGLSSGVLVPGPAAAAAAAEPLTSTSGSGTTSSRSAATTLSRAAAFSTLETGTSALK